MSIYYFFPCDEKIRNIGITYMCPQIWGGYFPHPYVDLHYPNMYLDFCLEDIKQNDIRNLTNAFSNCKKAIHVRIDLILNQYGLLTRNSKCDFPTKLEIVKSVGLLPTIMLKNINDERNLMEHDYRVPSEQRVREIIDVAELLYMATENLLSNTPIEVIVGFDTEPLFRLMKLAHQKGQLEFYELAVQSKDLISMQDRVDIQYINQNYRHFNGNITSGLQELKIVETIDLSHGNKPNWELIVSQLCEITKSKRQTNAGKIVSGDEVTMTSTITVPLNISSESFVDIMMQMTRQRKRSRIDKDPVDIVPDD